MNNMRYLAFAVILLLSLISTTESKSKGYSCVKSCDDCKKECSKLKATGSNCSITKPWRPNNFCTCHGIGAGSVPVCGAAQMVTSGMTFVPLVAALMYRTFMN